MSEPAPGPKQFVIDTNVILHDSSCIHQFEKHDVVIPIPVLEELDQFKKGSGTLNFHAREFLRAMDRLSAEKLFNGGARIGPGKGRLYIALERSMHGDIKTSFSSPKPDHHILNIAYTLAIEHPEKSIILVTKDVNFRMKARSVGIAAEDYKTDHVKDIASLYKGHRVVENVADIVFDRLYDKENPCPAQNLNTKPALLPNEYIILKNHSRSALAVYNALDATFKRVEKTTTAGITPKNAEQSFAMDALLDPGIQLVSLTGKAGTGKTLLALAAAVRQRRQYRQIFMARPVIPLSNKDIGFLPGDVENKLDPYMQPLFDNLGVIQIAEEKGGGRIIDDMLAAKKIAVAPLAYIRGRSLVKVFFIVDEAQNLTPHEIKTIITRAGEGTKIVFTGDIFQIDHPYLDTRSNGLSHLIEKMQGQGLYAHVNLEKGERSALADLASDLL